MQAAAFLVLCGLVVACGGGSGAAPSASASSAPSAPTAAPTAPTAPTAAPISARELPAPIREWNPERQPDGSFIVEAVSSPALEVGVAYRYLIGTHCGITLTTFDVAGSFWDPILNVDPSRLPQPEDDGVFVLVSASDAVWTSSSGFAIQLVRGPAEPRQVFFCD
jgi:hypothetical protein